MRKSSTLKLGLLLLATVPLMGAECPLIPDINEKVIQLAVGGSTSAEFDASGQINNHDDMGTIDLGADLDLAQILDDAGVDVDDVLDISMAGVSYRTVEPDPVADRQIVNGTLTLRRGDDPAVVVGEDFDVMVNEAVKFVTVPLNPAGVALVNDILEDLLIEAQGGIPAQDTEVTAHVTGQSLPSDVATDFVYEVKIDVTILGEVTVDVVDF